MAERATERVPAPTADSVSSAISRVARRHKALAGRLLRESGLYPGQELVLAVLWEHGPQRQVDLVEAVESDAPTMARSIARLEKAGLVRRTPSSTDRRAVIVEATRAGLALRPKVDRACAELERLTTAGLSTAGRDGILACLALLEETLTEAEAEAEADAEPQADMGAPDSAPKAGADAGADAPPARG